MTELTRVLKMPPLGEGSAVEQGTVVAVPFSVGDRVRAGDVLLEVETDKVTIEIPAEEAGVLQAVLLRVGDAVHTGVVFAKLSVAQEGGATLPETKQVENRAPLPTASEILGNEKLASPPLNRDDLQLRTVDQADLIIPANPSARRLARELGIDLLAVSGSGRGGRISKEDVKRHSKQIIQSTDRRGVTARPLPDFSTFGRVRRESLTNMATATSNNMMNAWSQIPHAWLQQTIDITELEDWRQQHKHEVKDQGGALTITVMLAKAVAIALKAFPKINSSYDEQSNEIVYKEYADIGIAVDTEQGLIVPALRQVDQKGLVVLSKELKLLSEKARTRKLIPKDLQGCGITISNLGGIGTSAIFPIVNWPQAAIIGLGASTIEPRFYGGECVPRRLLTLTLGFDHRIINGADGAKFLVYLKSLFEDMRLMLL